MIAVALQGQHSHVSWSVTNDKISHKATDDGRAIKSCIYRQSEKITTGIAVDGLAELYPVFAIIVCTIDLTYPALLLW